MAISIENFPPGINFKGSFGSNDFFTAFTAVFLPFMTFLNVGTLNDLNFHGFFKLALYFSYFGGAAVGAFAFFKEMIDRLTFKGKFFLFWRRWRIRLIVDN